MLSRTADHLYWMARYTERAENLARILEVNYRMSLLPQGPEIVEQGWIATLTIIKDLCIARDYQRDIYDFYLLYFAYTDLQESEVQWYWEGATRENIASIVRDRAEVFLQSTGNA